MGSWTRTMIRYRWAVVAVWAVVFLVSGAAASGLSDLLTNRFTLPGTDTARAESILEDHFGQKSTGSFSVVVKGQPGSAERLVPQVRAAAERAAKELPTGQLASVQPVSDAVVSATIVSNLEPADAKGHTDDMRTAAGEIPGAEIYVSGQAAIEHDLDPVQNHDLKVGELYIAIPIALLILVFVFGTLAFLLPFMLAAVAIPVTLGLVWIFANFMTLSTYLTNMVALIGLGIAIDYSLLIAMPLPFMRGFGLAGLLIPLVSVLAAVTLLPVLLYWLEDRLDRVRLVPKSVQERRWDHERGFWSWLAGNI